MGFTVALVLLLCVTASGQSVVGQPLQLQHLTLLSHSAFCHLHPATPEATATTADEGLGHALNRGAGIMQWWVRSSEGPAPGAILDLA